MGRERAGAGIEREKPCLFGFFLEPLVEGRGRGGGKARDDEPNLDWIAFANESVDSGVWPGFGLEAGTFVEKKSWSAMGLFPVVGGVVAGRGRGNWCRNGLREREEKERDYSPRLLVDRLRSTSPERR